MSKKMSWNEYAQSFARFDAQQELIRRKQEERKRQLAEQEFRQRIQHRVRTCRGDFYNPPPPEPRSANPAYNPQKPSCLDTSFYQRAKPAPATKKSQEMVEINVSNQVYDPKKHLITKYVSEFFTPNSKRPVAKAETVIVSEPRVPGQSKPNTKAIDETITFMKQKQNEMMQVISNSDNAGKMTYQAPAKQGIIHAITTVTYNPQEPAIINGITYKPRMTSERRASIDQAIPSINIQDASFNEPLSYNRSRPNHRSIASFDEEFEHEESLDDPQSQQAPPQRRIRFSNQNAFYRYPSASSVYDDHVAYSGATVTRPTVSRPVNSGASTSSGRGQFGFIDNFGGFRK